MPTWTSVITYSSRDLGEIDVEFDYDTQAELDVFIRRGPGISTIRKIVTTPFLKPAGGDDTIEAVVGRLAIIDDLKEECYGGATAAPARLTLVHTGDRANADFIDDVPNDFSADPGSDCFGAYVCPGPGHA